MTPHSPTGPPTPHEPSHSTESAHESVVALVAGGLPLESGLRALSEEVPSRRLSQTLRRMSDELAGGHPPEEVLSQSRRGLPNYLGGLVRAGVQSGQLGEFLEQFLIGVRRRRACQSQLLADDDLSAVPDPGSPPAWDGRHGRDRPTVQGHL